MTTATAPAPRPATASALVEEARRLFAMRGYDGASVRAITRAADANLGAITYHFGSKRALYTAVLETVLEPLADRLARAAASEGAALDRLERAVRSFFDHLADNPDQPFLILQEIAAGKPPPSPVASVMRRAIGSLAGIVADGQREGTIRPGDPVLLSLSAVSQPVYLSLLRHATGPVLGLDQGDPDSRERIVTHAVGFVRAGLAAGDEAAP